MADERYQKLLGIDPADETPTYYELFCIDRSETDEPTIEAAYKTQIRKLQAIRTSKDKGFIEFLKEELRKARRILTNVERRKEYDVSLQEDAVETFKEFVQPLMALGQITRSVFDTMVAKGVSDGLEEAVAAQIITEMAAESGATIELDEDLENSGYDEGEPDDEPFVEETYGREYVEIPTDPPDSPRPQGEVVLTAATPPPRRPSEVGRVDPRSDAGRVPEPEPEPAAPAGPWLRGLDGPQRAWGRRRGTSWSSNRQVKARRSRPQAGRSGQGRVSHKHRQQSPPQPSAGDDRELEEAIRLFNLGAKLAKIASDVHEKLKFYFPPANGKTERTKQINGVSYEKVFDTEQKMYRDTLKKFETAQSRVGASGEQADQLRQKSTQNIALIKGYLDEIRQHKLRRLAGLSKNEELRAWQEFVSNRRSSRVSQMIGEG